MPSALKTLSFMAIFGDMDMLQIEGRLLNEIEIVVLRETFVELGNG